MQLLSDIVRDTDENFGLGNRAAVLVSEAAKCLFDAGHGGLKGFLERLEAEGLVADLGNWRNTGVEIRFPEGLWVDKVLGVEAITRIGRDLGMANARVRTALAYVIPHLIRYFASGSELPEHLPPAVEAYLAAAKPEHLAPRSRGIKNKKTGRHKKQVAKTAGTGKFFWAIGVVALLVSGYFLGQDVLTRSPPLTSASSAKEPVAEIVAQTPVVGADKAPDSQPQAPESLAPGSKLVIRSYGNQIEYLAFVNSPEVRTQLMEKLQRSFGAPRLVGDVVVDATRAEPLWMAQLDRLLPLVSVPGLDVRLEGNTVRVGGWLAEEDRTSVLNSLMSALGSSYRFGYLREEDIERSQDARQYMVASLAHVGAELKPQDLVAILNRWLIVFPEGDATFPDEAKDILSRVAEVLKMARPQSIIEIQGHVDVENTPGLAQKLSLDRANAVRDALIKSGVPSGLLRTKGYGSEKRLAMGGAPFDHARNQRIEFRVIQVCDPYFPCESSIPAKRVPAPDPNLPLPDGTAPASRGSESTTLGTVPSPKPTLRSIEPTSQGAPATDSTRTTPGRGTETEGSEELSTRSQGSKLKALTEELPPPPKPRIKPSEPPKPPAAKPPEWYDPLGLF